MRKRVLSENDMKRKLSEIQALVPIPFLKTHSFFIIRMKKNKRKNK